MTTPRSIWDRKRFLRNLIFIFLALLAWYLVKSIVDEIPLRIVINIMLLAMVISAYFLLQRHTNTAGHIVIFTGFLGLNSAIYTSGGLLSYAILSLLIIPVFALPISGRKTAHVWLAISFITYCIYYMAWTSGLEIPNLSTGENQANHAFFGIIALLIGIYSLSVAFMNTNEHYAMKIKSQVRELKEEAFKRHHAEQAAYRASEAKSFFLANMSHEIRTPLNGIVGIVDLLNDAPMDEQYKKYIRTLNEASHLLLEQVNDILDFSKIESGEFKLLETSFSIQACLKGLASLFKLSAEEKGLNFTMTISPDLPDAVFSDEKCVRQVISNIVSNAIKYTQEGSVTLEAQYKDETLVFYCRDTGLGISEEAQDNLFTPFTQDYSEQNQFIQGTGLGLSITHSLCEMLEGSIDVESKINKGSCFIIRIPMPPRESLETQFKTQHNVQEFNVLVAEDNPVNQLVIKGLLKKIGCPHMVYEDGKKALQALIDMPTLPDVILSDIQMPNMNGYELIKAIRADERFQHLHVVALTANATAEEQNRSVEAGFNGFLTKPIERGKLLDYLANI